MDTSGSTYFLRLSANVGEGFMPSLKQCSSNFVRIQMQKKFFNSLILDIFQRLGHFFRKGIKPFPALDMRKPISPKFPYKYLIVNGAIMSQQKMAKSCQCREGLHGGCCQRIFYKNCKQTFVLPPKIGAKYRKFGLYPYQRRS